MNRKDVGGFNGVSVHHYVYANSIIFISCAGCGKTTFLDLLTGRRHKGTMQVAMVTFLTKMLL